MLTFAQRRAALQAAFATTGIATATWVTRTPAIRDATNSSTADMGIIIAAMSLGAMVGIAAGGPLVGRLGARFVTVLGLLGVSSGIAVIALGATVGQGWIVALGLALVGFGSGAGEIGFNVEGVTLEGEAGRTIVPSLHGAFSVGVCGGALIGLAANIAHVPAGLHLFLVGVLGIAATIWVGSHLAGGTGRTNRHKSAEAKTRYRPWKEPRTLAIGVIILAMAMAEGSANDWLPLIVVDGFGLSAAMGSLVYAFFAASMASGRFVGGFLIDRFGRAPIMVASAVSAIGGIVVVAIAPSVAIGMAGVLLWGLGAALGFPVALSAAGDVPENSSQRVTAVTTAGYAAFLVGPPLLGIVGESAGLRMAILLVAVMVFVSCFFSRAVNKPDLSRTRNVGE